VLGKVPTTNAFCEGLRTPIDELADALVNHGESTPDSVILTGTKVILGYDGGCDA
jgi:hypothetical protein